jgi:hypothetical protein
VVPSTLLEVSAGKEVSRAYSAKQLPGMLLGVRVGPVVRLPSHGCLPRARPKSVAL